jgi:WhiB family redox-sensing transcriptional regulator
MMSTPLLGSGDRSWMDRAACAGHPYPDIWYPDNSNIHDRYTREAARICAACPVRHECFEYGRSERYGIFAGVMMSSRTAIPVPSAPAAAGPRPVPPDPEPRTRPRKRAHPAAQDPAPGPVPAPIDAREPDPVPGSAPDPVLAPAAREGVITGTFRLLSRLFRG